MVRSVWRQNPERQAILRARQCLGLELTRGMLLQMASAVRARRTRYLGPLAGGKQQHMILVDGRPVYFVFDPAGCCVCTITNGPADSSAGRPQGKAVLSARRAAGRHGTRRGRSFRTDPLGRFAMRA
jgi:hypothetical protein